MFGKSLFILTTLAYGAIVTLNIFKPNTSGDRGVYWSLLVFGVLAIFILCSIFLTLNMVMNGKFNWLSEVASTRNIVVGIGWILITIAVVNATMISADNNSYQADTASVLDNILQYSSVWIPLLMLVPYALLLTSGGYQSFSPYAYRIPLLAGCIIGITFYSIRNSSTLQEFLRPTLEKGKSMQEINNTNDIDDLIKFVSKENSKSVIQAATAKIKVRADVERDLKQVLDQYDKGFYFTDVYDFLSENKIEHPAVLTASLNATILELAQLFSYRLVNNSQMDVLKILNVEMLIKALDLNYKNDKASFRSSILKLQTSLEATPREESYIKIIKKYQKALKIWLANE